MQRLLIWIIGVLARAATKRLTAENLKLMLDRILDAVEVAARDSAWTRSTLVPIAYRIREITGVTEDKNEYRDEEKQ